MGFPGLCVIGAFIGLLLFMAALMRLLPVGELPDYCTDGGVFDISCLIKYAWRLPHF